MRAAQREIVKGHPVDCLPTGHVSSPWGLDTLGYVLCIR